MQQEKRVIRRPRRPPVVKLSENLHENPEPYCKILAYAYAMKKQNKLEELDGMFGFPDNKKDLDKNQLRTYAPKNDDQIRKIIQELFDSGKSAVKFASSDRRPEEVLAFSEWLAENGGFSGLIEDDEPWKKCEGLCYIAFLRQYGLHNYRTIDALHRINWQVIAEAVTVLYNCNDFYDQKDLRVSRIKELVHMNENKFEPCIWILQRTGWWDERVTSKKFQLLLQECNYRLIEYVKNIGKDWSDKVLNPKFTTKEEIMDHLKRLREGRKNKLKNQLIRKNKKFNFDSFLNDTNAADEETELEESDDESADITLRMEVHSEDESDNTSEANENDMCAGEDNSDPQINQSLSAPLSSPILSHSIATNVITNVIVLEKTCPKRKSDSESNEHSQKRQKPSEDGFGSDRQVEDFDLETEKPEKSDDHDVLKHESDYFLVTHPTLDTKNKIADLLNSTIGNSLCKKQLELQEEQKVKTDIDDKESLVGRLIDFNTSYAEMKDRSPDFLSVDDDSFLNRNILDTYEKQWESQEFCDTALVTACGKKIMAHRLILSAWSPVFSSDLKSTPKNEESKIEVEDVSYTTVYEMLRFMYSRKIKLDQESVGGLLAVADRYQVRHLKKKCQEYLLKDINIKNTLNILRLCKIHNMPDLSKKVNEFAKEHGKLIFKHSTAQTTASENESDFYYQMVQNIAVVKNSPR